MTGAADGPLVSAVVIFKDEERFLAEAIGSVLHQTLADWELILVDDGSADRSGEIAAAAARADPGRVRLLTHPGGANRGMSASRNLGARAARGRYLAYLDADDVWTPAKLEEQVALMRAHPEAAFVYAPLELWHSWRGPGALRDGRYGVDRHGRQPFPDRLVPPPELLCRFLEDEDLLPGGALFRRDVLEAVGGGDERFRDAYEDAVVLVKVCLRWPAWSSTRTWYRYRQREDSVSKLAEARGQAGEERREFLAWVAAYLDAQGVHDPPVRRALDRATMPYRHPWRSRLSRAPRALRDPYWWLARGDAVARRTLPEGRRRQLSNWRRARWG